MDSSTWGARHAGREALTGNGPRSASPSAAIDDSILSAGLSICTAIASKTCILPIISGVAIFTIQGVCQKFSRRVLVREREDNTPSSTAEATPCPFVQFRTRRHSPNSNHP